MLGAVELSSGEDANPLFAAVAAELQSLGYYPCGYLQTELTKGDGANRDIFLTSLHDRDAITLSRDLAQDDGNCVTDSGVLSEVAAKLDALLEGRIAAHSTTQSTIVPEILIVNRFGRCEAEGAGLRSVIEKACMGDIPVLIAVRPKYLDKWREFCGEYGQPLAADRGEILEWCRQVIRSRSDE